MEGFRRRIIFHLDRPEHPVGRAHVVLSDFGILKLFVGFLGGSTSCQSFLPIPVVLDYHLRIRDSLY